MINWNLLKRRIIFWWQRRARGWDDSETWNLDTSYGRLIASRLKRFKEISIAYPSELTPEEWDNILDEMIFAFSWYAEGKHYDSHLPEFQENSLKADRGLQLFVKYYNSLWW